MFEKTKINEKEPVVGPFEKTFAEMLTRNADVVHITKVIIQICTIASYIQREGILLISTCLVLDATVAIILPHTGIVAT